MKDRGGGTAKLKKSWQNTRYHICMCNCIYSGEYRKRTNKCVNIIEKLLKVWYDKKLTVGEASALDDIKRIGGKGK